MALRDQPLRADIADMGVSALFRKQRSGWSRRVIRRVGVIREVCRVHSFVSGSDAGGSSPTGPEYQQIWRCAVTHAGSPSEIERLAEVMELGEFGEGERGRPKLTRNLLEVLEDAEDEASRAGNERLRLRLKTAALAVWGWERQVREICWIVEHWPMGTDPWEAPTPWFGRVRREQEQREQELAAEINMFQGGARAS